MPSNIAIGTAKYSDHSGGARPPKMNTTVSSNPKTSQTARYRTSRLRRLRIGCMDALPASVLHFDAAHHDHAAHHQRFRRHDTGRAPLVDEAAEQRRHFAGDGPVGRHVDLNAAPE